MGKSRIVILRKKILRISAVAIITLLLFSFFIYNQYLKSYGNSLPDRGSSVIVIDPGHGGIDGGTSRGELLEKDINLDISMKLKTHLEEKGYKVVLTREEDISLDSLSSSGDSRHQRDLRARVDIINASKAGLFLSIHGNCHWRNVNADGSIVFYGTKYPQSETLAYCLQRALNNMVVDGRKRTVHDPQTGEFYLLKYTNVPGAIIETAFLSNAEEQRLLGTEEFKDGIAEAIANGVSKYMDEIAAEGNISSIYTAAASTGAGTDESDKAKLAIILDDFGQSRAGIKEMMAIQRHLTFAVMPFLEFSRSDAQAAYEKGYEVIVHLPMEANYGRLEWLGPRPIMAGMKKEDVKQLVNDAFDDVPYSVGANIHMGSKASSVEDIVTAILDVVKEKNLYFVDSRTADHPIGKKLSDKMGIRCYDRDIFIDEKRPKEAIKVQLRKAAEIALKKKQAIAVGHVGTEGGKATAEAIQEMLPEFDRDNVQLVFVSELDD